MRVIQKIQERISKLAEGITFKYEQLAIEPHEYVATAKAIERLIAKDAIRRVSAGVFYKPKKTVFGELGPSEEELLKPYLFEKGKRIAYVTGTSLYNQMGLTAQVPKSIKIASRDKRITVSSGNVRATPVKSYVDVSENNFYLLGLLDALKDFKKIPDLDKGAGIKIISKKLEDLGPGEIELLIKCSLAYPPRVRGFLGAILESIKASADLTGLKKSLNPLSEYSIGVEGMLPTGKEWNVK